jgi:rhodanese-related sulfurtransferase
MKRKTALLGLVLALSLVLGSFQMSFAAESQYTDGASVDRSKIQSVVMKDINNEAKLEDFIFDLNADTAAAGYKLISSQELQSWIAGNKDMMIIDTMPDGWYRTNHVVGAFNAVAGDNGPNGEFTDEQKTALLDLVKSECGTKTTTTTKYYNKKTKKWQTKKIKGAKTKKVKVTKPVMNKTIVVYCGFIGCKRSHQAAKYLVEQGYTKVYRYAGGISAWADNAELYPEQYLIEVTPSVE